MAQKKKLSLTVKITISLVLGVIAGLLLQGRSDIAVTYIKPFGTIYLNLIKMVVVPVVLLSIMQGIISLHDVRKVGSIGVKTVAFYMCTTALAVTLGLLFANILNVGGGYVIATEDLVYEAKEAPSFIDTLVNIFPSNFFQPMASMNMPEPGTPAVPMEASVAVRMMVSCWLKARSMPKISAMKMAHTP